MSLDDLGIVGDYEVRELGIDGDIIVYQPCCIFNEDDDFSRKQIAKYIDQKINRMMADANCDEYTMFLTTKFNFRDDLVDDYKANRKDIERPVNLAWAKRYAMQQLNAVLHKGLEADDLLGIWMTEKPGRILWSLDKDLRQIPGKHLDDETRKVVTIDYRGQLTDRGKKVYFTGMLGFYYQLLIGDSTDHIIGCGKREKTVYKSGAKKGQSYLKRKGIGPKAALKILNNADNGSENLQPCLDAVIAEYKSIHGDNWQSHLETQANLLWMVREQRGEIIRRWTFDDREEYFNLVDKVVLHDIDTTAKTVAG